MNKDGSERELLGAWALDAVDDVERAAVERAIREDPEVAAEARALRETVARLALADAVPPPPSLRGDVLTAVATTPQDGTGETTHHPIGTRGRRTRQPQRWLAAAAVVLAAGVPTTLAVQQAQRAEQAEQHVATIAEALAQPDAHLLSADVAGGGRAAAVITDTGTVFTAWDLPQPAGQQVYQLWVIADGQPESAGVLHLEDGLVTVQVAQLPEEATLAMTVEPDGGSPQPTSDPIATLPST